MTRHLIRIAVALTAALLLSSTLAGCVPNRPGGTVDWLRGQSGVASAEVLADHSDAFESSGLVRGELAGDLNDSQLASLVTSIIGYASSHDHVSIRLGRNGIDFVVGDRAETDSAIALWESLSAVPNLANAVVRDGSVHARTLRVHAVGVLADLEPLNVDISLEGFTDRSAIDNDTAQDDFFDDYIFNIDSLELNWPSSCTPMAAERSFAESFFARDEVGGGSLALCTAFELYYLAGASLATVIPALYDELAGSDLLSFPVTAHQIVGSAPDGHLVMVTPGDPAAFGVLASLEVDSAPDLYYTLNEDRSLDVTEYGTQTADLLALVSASPVAATLPTIRIEGKTSAINGSLPELPIMLQQVTALMATSDIFSNVELGPSTGLLYLSSEDATGADVVAAAQTLRASGAWISRSFVISYGSTSLTIVDGIATVNDPNYTDPQVVNAFIRAWEATA